MRHNRQWLTSRHNSRPRLRAAWGLLLAGAWLGCGCALRSPPTQFLDQRTGASVAALPQPLEFVQGVDGGASAVGQRPSFAYVGPVQWDRSGVLSYALWIHIAPGERGRVGDLRAAGALTVLLDDGAITLAPAADIPEGRSPYRPVVAWGQSAYFALDTATFVRLAASRRLTLAVAGAAGGIMSFAPTRDPHPTLVQAARAWGISAD